MINALQQQQISWKVIFPDSRKFIESIEDYRKSIGKAISPGILILKMGTK
jgi:hypothetical protein